MVFFVKRWLGVRNFFLPKNWFLKNEQSRNKISKIFCQTLVIPTLGKVELFEMQCNFIESFKTWNEIEGSSSVICKATALKLQEFQ